MRKKGVLFIIDTFIEIGGAEKNLIQLATGLDKETYSPRVCCLRGGRLVDSLRSSGIQVTNLNMKKIYDFKGIREGIRLFAYLRREQIKIVVTYHESSDFWAGAVAKLAGVPVVISSRRDMGYQLKPRHIAAYRALNTIFDKIVVVSNAVADILTRDQRIPRHKTITIYNGIETEKYSRPLNLQIKQDLGLDNPSYPVIGLTASMRRIKGIEYFIEAASLIRKVVPDVYFLIVGYQDEKEYSEELITLIRNLGLERHVYITGVRLDVPEILPAMDIGVISSTTEGFSNSILEYMADGKPVVATETGGNPEIVLDGETGILVPTRDAEKLADALLKLLKDPQLRQNMGEAGRERVRNYFSRDAMITNIENLYGNLLNEKENRARLRGFTPQSLRTVMAQTAKVVLAEAAHYSRALHKSKPSGEKNGIIILAYHRVHNDPFDPLTMSIRSDIFEAHIRHIKKYYNPVSLETAVNLMQEDREVPERTIALTFEDGYRDNFTNAYPILKHYGVPATIFLAVGAVETGGRLWYDEIVEMVQTTSSQSLDVTAYGLGTYSLKTIAARMQVSRALVTRAKYMGKHKRGEFMKALRAALRRSAGNAPRNMLSWDEINLMKKNGISFESHGMSHSILTALSPEAWDYEFLESKNLIYHNTGHIPAFFAYPNGGTDDYNNEAIEHLKTAGYVAACTLIKGTNINAPLFELRRYCVTPGILLNPFGRYSPHLFDMKVSEN